MKLSPADARRLIEMPGATLGPKSKIGFDDADTCEEELAKTRQIVEGQAMVMPSVAVIKGVFTAVIPAITKGNTNGDESRWHTKMKRKLSAKAAVRDTLGPLHGLLTPYAEAFHGGKALRVKFTRLGGRKLDRGNLAVSMKAIEDAVEGALLANDGSPQWHSTYEQEPGGPVGVRVEISLYQ